MNVLSFLSRGAAAVALALIALTVQPARASDQLPA